MRNRICAKFSVLPRPSNLATVSIPGDAISSRTATRRLQDEEAGISPAQVQFARLVVQ